MHQLRMLLVAILAVCAITSDGASITNSEANRASRMMLSIVDDNAGNIHPWRGDKGYQNFLAAMAETASGDNARIGRRALSEDPFEAAANVVKSLTAGANAAGADAAASAAGTAAGKQFKSFTDTLLHPVDATPPPSTTPPATTSVAAPPLAASQLAATAPAPSSAPTPPSTTTHQAAAPAPSTVPAAAAPSAWEQQDPVQERTQEVPNFQLGAFLVEHANLIANTTGGNGTHLIPATRLAQQQLQAETHQWMEHQHTGRKLLQIPTSDDMAKALEALPQNFAKLPGQVAEDFAGFGKNLGNQALNSSYYVDQFDQLLHKLQDPIALQAGAQLFANNLCLFSTNLGALEASATGVSVSPSLINIGSAGVNVAPQAISISPALVSVGATGVSVAPQGLNIAPALIAVTPGRVSVNPQGGTISPAGISVSADDKPAPKPAKPGQGRRNLLQTMSEDISHTVDSMKAQAQAAVDQFMGASSTTTPAAPPAAGPAQPATTEATNNATGGNFKIPVASEGLQNWAAVVGTMCKRANMDSTACLNQYFNHTSSMLDGLAGKYEGLQGSDLPGAVGRDFPKLDIKKPTFFSGSNDVVSSNVAAVQLGLTGMSFSACAVPLSPVGANVSPTGISIGPTVISISATGVNVQPQGLNISPNLIVVGPYDTSVSGQGLNIAPALIAVSPTKTVINPVGPLKISDAKVSKTLPALPGPDNTPGPDNNS